MTTRLLFRDLLVGQTFEFASVQTDRFSGMARGPWRKISARKYQLVAGNNPKLTYRVGTIRVEVVPTP